MTVQLLKKPNNLTVLNIHFVTDQFYNIFCINSAKGLKRKIKTKGAIPLATMCVPGIYSRQFSLDYGSLLLGQSFLLPLLPERFYSLQKWVKVTPPKNHLAPLPKSLIHTVASEIQSNIIFAMK